MLKFENTFDKEGFVDLIIDAVFEELVKGKEIAYFNSKFGFEGYATKCIFC